MALTNQGKLNAALTVNTTPIGPGRFTDVFFQNQDGTDPLWISYEIPVANQSVKIPAGGSLSTKDMPQSWKDASLHGYYIICTAGTPLLTWHA